MNYLIKETTKEQRKELVKKALVISASGTDVPTEEALKLAKQYIDGEIELKEMQAMIINKYKNS